MTERIETIGVSQFTGDSEPDSDRSTDTGIAAVRSTVVPPTIESEWGYARHRPAGEPGSLVDVELRTLTERPDDN